MNIFHKIALQGLKKNRTRTIVTVIGVVLSSLMITGVTTFAVSLMNYMVEGAMQRYGDWGAAFLDADASFVQERMLDPQVSRAVAFENVGYAKAEGATNPDRPYFFVAGFGQEAFEALPLTLLSGRLPENDSEILISARAAADAGLSFETGDTLTLSTGSRMRENRELSQAVPYSPEAETFVPKEEKTYTVTGICATPVFEPENAPGYTMITGSSIPKAQTFSLFVTLKNMRGIYSYVEKTAEGHDYMLNYDVLRIMGISDRPADKVFMTFLYSFGGIVLLIIMTGSVFLIYNSFSISLSERIREIGMLASVGATAKQLRNSVLFEGLCIGAVGIPIGILAGLGSIYLILSAVSDNFGAILFEGVPMRMHVSVLSVVGAVAVSLITILLSAYLPAKKAVRLPVMECIRQTNEIKVEAKSMKISPRQQRMYGLEGTLALKNFKRNRKRYRSIVLSLVLSIVLFVCTNALIDSMQQSVGRFQTVSDYDIGFGTKDIPDEELFSLFEQLKTAEGVTEGSVREVIPYSSTVGADMLTDACRKAIGGASLEGNADLALEVYFLDDAFFEKIVEELGLPMEEYTGGHAKLIAIAKINDESEEVKGAEDLKDMFQSADVDLTVVPQLTEGTAQGHPVSITAVEFIPPDIPPVLDSDTPEILPYTFQILAPWSVKEKLAPSELPINTRVKGLCFDSERPSQSTSEMQKMIQKEKVSCSFVLMNSKEMFEQFRNYIFIANVFAYTFIALISLIAAANVFNTISTNIRLRRRELAMLRSVGMADRDFNKMMRFECAFYGLKALVIGIPLSLLLSVWIVKITMESDVRISLPWGSVGISILSVFLVIFVTMMYAVNRIKKENIIDALRDEMT